MEDHKISDDRARMLSDLLTRVLASQEDERRTVIHALQENVGQTLAALALNLRVLEHHNEHPQVADLIGNMRGLTTDALREIDALQQSLYPLALGSQGVISAVEVYIQQFAHTSQIQMELDAEVPPRRLPSDMEITLFRIVEGILEHLRDQRSASQIGIRLRFVKNYLYLVIESDGAAHVKSWRTELMAERVQARGGQCAIVPLPLAGTRFEIALPLRNEAQG